MNGVKCAYAQVPAEAFQGMAGEEITQMLQFFDEFGCESLPLWCVGA